MSEAITILCTCPDEATAKRLANGMIENRQAACVNVLPEVRSVYRWEGEIQDESEALMIIKTSHAHFSGIEHWLGEHHPYDVPELLALDAKQVSGPYLRWLKSVLST